MNGKLIRIGKHWFAETRNSMQSEPVEQVIRYRIIERYQHTGDYYHELEPGVIVTYESGGSGWLLRGGTSITCLISENKGEYHEEPIPPPKTKLETRYKDGRWQKYLKVKGWVPA